MIYLALGTFILLSIQAVAILAVCRANRRNNLGSPKQSRGLAATANIHRNETGYNRASSISDASRPERLPGDARLQLCVAVEKGGTSEGKLSTPAKTGYETVEDNRQVPSPINFRAIRRSILLGILRSGQLRRIS